MCILERSVITSHLVGGAFRSCVRPRAGTTSEVYDCNSQTHSTSGNPGMRNRVISTTQTMQTMQHTRENRIKNHKKRTADCRPARDRFGSSTGDHVTRSRCSRRRPRDIKNWNVIRIKLTSRFFMILWFLRKYLCAQPLQCFIFKARILTSITETILSVIKINE